MAQNQKQIKECPRCRRKLGWFERQSTIVHYDSKGTVIETENDTNKRFADKWCNECGECITTCIAGKEKG